MAYKYKYDAYYGDMDIPEELKDSLSRKSSSSGGSSTVTDLDFSKHYLLAANHYHQNSHRFFLSDGSYTNVTATINTYATDSSNNKIGNDWIIQIVPGGIPDDVPNMEFIGFYGTETNINSLFHLSPSLLNGAPAIQISQANTVNLGYLATSASGTSTSGIFAPTNSVGYSLRLTLPTDWNWINTSYPSMNAVHPYYNKKCIKMKDGTDWSGTVTISDIDSFYDQTESDNFILYKGQHYPIAGDSSRPLMGYFNNHLWLYGIFFTAAGGQSCLSLPVTLGLDSWMRADSLSRFGSEEGLTFIDCCDLDENNTYHTH